MTSVEARGSAKLYSHRLLSLSAELAHYPLDDDLELTSESRSRTCGSMLKLGLDSDERGVVTKIGLQVSACAVGQSSAAILARAVIGKDGGDLSEILGQVESWLQGVGPLPAWPEFDALEPALPHTGRHGALLLPWKAAVAALSSRCAAG